MTGSPFDAPFGSGRAAEGDECSACDGTGHVCADEGTASYPAGSHGSRLHPWDGLSDRADACDHGGGAPCPACMIPPGQARERPPRVVDARPPTRYLRDVEPVTGLDRVRAAVERDRDGRVNELGRIVSSPIVPEGTAYLFAGMAPGYVCEPDRRPWWRRTVGRLAAAVAARLPTRR